MPGADRFPRALVAGATALMVGAWCSACDLSTDRGEPDLPLGEASAAAVAVLPFDNATQDRDQDYFADGVTDAVISQLSKVGSLRVISRTSSMRYKGSTKPLRQIASELGVDALVAGTVDGDADEVRLAARLVDAGTDEEVWSGSYSGAPADAVRLESDVALDVVRQLEATITPDEATRIASVGAVDPAARAAYFKGLHLYNRMTPGDFDVAARYMRLALQHDPTYAPPRAYLAWIQLVPGRFGWVPPDRAASRSLAEEARRLKPDNPQAHLSVAVVDYLERDWEGAERGFRRAIELAPSQAEAYVMLSDLRGARGHVDEQIALAARAVELDPLSPINLCQLGFGYVNARDYDAAVGVYENVNRIAPEFGASLPDAANLFSLIGEHDRALAIAQRSVERLGTPTTHASLAYIQAVAGRTEQARSTLYHAIDEGRRDYLSPARVALAYGALGDMHDAFLWLDKAIDERDYYTMAIKVNPVYDTLRRHPRFGELLDRMEFPG